MLTLSGTVMGTGYVGAVLAHSDVAQKHVASFMLHGEIQSSVHGEMCTPERRGFLRRLTQSASLAN